MNPNLKKLIRSFHLKIDGLIGQLFFSDNHLGKISNKSHSKITLGNFTDFRYSKKEHFSKFLILPIHKNQSPRTCDLKVYQDSLVYTFISDNLPEGSRLLEIGGGESRIIDALKDKYEIWNLDKLEGSGYGPKELISKNDFYIIQDYIGNFSEDLPVGYFDLVFSISTIEHIPQSYDYNQKAIKDIQRVLKPGGYSLHCIDAILFREDYFIHPFAKIVHDHGLILEDEVSYQELKNSKDIWLLPPYAFYTRWFHLVKKTYRIFGFPFSVNLLWQK